MKFTLERAALLKSLGHVQSVVERRNTIPILANVLIRAAGQDVSFAATDMEIEINETVPGQVANRAPSPRPRIRFMKSCANCPKARRSSSMPTNANQLTLSSGRSHFKLGCLPVDDFPKMPEGDLQP